MKEGVKARTLFIKNTAPNKKNGGLIMKRAAGMILAMVMSVSLLSGCSAVSTGDSGNKTATTAASAASAAVTTAAATAAGSTAAATKAGAPATTAAAAATGKKKVIGLSISDMNNAYFVGMEIGLRQACETAGYDLIVANANSQMSKQISDVEDLINQKVDLIMINALDSGSMGEIHKACKASGIPFMYIDRGAQGMDDVVFVETNNVEAGQKCAEYLVEALKERYQEPRGKIVMLEGVPSASSSIDRGEGFMSVIKDYPEIKVVSKQIGNFNQETSLNVMTNVLQAQPEIDAVFNYNDDNALGAAKAIEAAGRYFPQGDPHHIINIGVDGMYQALEALRDGQMDITYAQEPLQMGKLAVEYATKIFNGEKDLKGHFYSPITKITKDNWNDKNNWAVITNK